MRAGIAPDEVQAIEAELARAIGPLAHVLMKKSVARASDARGLRELLSVSIQDPVDPHPLRAGPG
jgi:hypothetical protein